jgi:hypothetical protein
MQEPATYSCAHCGELIEIVVDPSAGSHQEYVEDCWVCCRPNCLQITIDETGSVSVAAEAED